MIADRFDCIARGDWGTVLTYLQSDESSERQRAARRREHLDDPREDESLAQLKLRKTALHLVRCDRLAEL